MLGLSCPLILCPIMPCEVTYDVTPHAPVGLKIRQSRGDGHGQKASRLKSLNRIQEES